LQSCHEDEPVEGLHRILHGCSLIEIADSVPLTEPEQQFASARQTFAEDFFLCSVFGSKWQHRFESIAHFLQYYREYKPA
jgi:hypothetical protein